MKRLKHRLWIGWLIATTLLSVAPAWAEQTLKIGLLPIADTLLLYVAEKEGLFAKHNLKVDLISFQSALEKDAALRAGQLDGHFCEISAVIVQRAAGFPFVAIASTSHTSPEARVFGLVTSPAAANLTLEDLKGHTIAIARQSIVDFLTDVFLAEAGLPDDYLVRRDIRKIPVRMQMLLASQVEAALLPEPLLSIAEHGGGRVLLDDRKLNMPLAIIALSEDKADLETVNNFRAALTEAAIAINNSPDKYRDFMLELRLIPPQVADTFQMPRFDLQNIPLTLPSPELFQQYVNWLIKNEVLSLDKNKPGALTPPSYYEVIWPGKFDEAKP